MDGERNRSARSLKKMLNRLRRFFMAWIEPAEPAEPDDPHAYRTVPARRPPTRGGAAAVAEIEEDSDER